MKSLPPVSKRNQEVSMSGSIVDLGSLLTTLYSGSSGTSTQTSTDPLGDLTRAEANSTKDVAQTAAEPQVARDIATFTAQVAAAKTPAALLQNPTVLKVLLTANGLGDQVQYTALAQKALLSNTADPNGLANQLTSNSAWKSTASLYDFANKGLSVLQDPSTISTVANAYAEVLWRQSLDAATPGLSNALTFRDEASSITSVDQILGDPVMRAVVTGALGIPQTIAIQDLPAQEQAISTRLDITQFKNPAFVNTFVQQYLIQTNLTGASSGSSSPSIDQLAVQSAGLVV
jgi:Protein of unknown function (DUF1217)